MFQFRLRTDLPFDRDAAAGFLPWIIGFMVFLCVITVAAALTVERVADRWRQGLAGNLTVELPFAPDLDTGKRAEALDAAVNLVTETPGITGAAVLDDDQIAALLSPWLGPDATQLDVPLPTMIAVTRRTDVPIDLKALQAKLDTLVAGAQVDDHGDWVADALVFLRSLQALAAALAGLALAAAALTVIFVTRTGLATHRAVIEVVHLIGAPDRYIARQFQAQALKLGILGGIVGLACGAGTVIGVDKLLAFAARQSLSPGMPAPTGLSFDFRLLPWQWAVLAVLPLVVALVAMMTARFTVLRSLARMP
ncbi:MAG TPA: FtsX-like permease family protein [Dongiaceae bacterium]|nr:FtsX-like permease family protein [Dongiaceae bacterium]